MHRPLFLLILVLATFTAFFYQYYEKNQQQNLFPQAINNIEKLQQLQKNIALDLLLLENGSNHNYDRISQDMRHFQNAIHALSHGQYGLWQTTKQANIDKNLALLHQTAIAQESLIEDFKTHHAILSNSQRFVAGLSGLNQDSILRRFDQHPDMTNLIIHLIKDIFGFLHNNSLAHKSDLLQRIQQAKTMTQPSMSVRDKRVWHNILRHFEIILAEKGRVNRLSEQILLFSNSPVLEQLDAHIQHQRNADIIRLNRDGRILTLLVALTALSLMISLSFSLAKNRRIRKALRELENQQFALDQHAIVSTTDIDGNILYVNDKFIERTGFTRAELLGRNHRMLKSDEHPKAFFQEMWSTILAGRVWQGDICDLDREGNRIWVNSTIIPFLDDHDKPYQFMAIRTDFTAMKETEKELFEARDRAQVILASIGDAVISINEQQRIDYMNPVAEGLTGLPQLDVVGQKLSDIFEILDEQERTPEYLTINECLVKGHTMTLSTNILMNRIDGREFAVEIIIAPTHDQSGNITGAVLAMHDMTETRGLTRKIAHQANHDPLTGLSNRHEFERILRKLLHKSKEEGREHVLCYIDLDHFKVVNDTCGHIAGDELLRQVSEILRAQIRDRDLLARIGGDEFSLLLGECPVPRAQDIANNLCREIKAFRFSWEGRIFQIGASIGLVPITPESIDTVTVMRHADTACYMAKDQGRNGCYLYHEADKDLSERTGEMNWISRLTQALDDDRFIIYSHPTQPLHGAEPYREILLRLRTVDGQIISPMAFIPAAERHGLMADIDRWVIHAVLSRYSEWQSQQGVIAVNLSGASLSDKTLADYIIAQIAEFEVNPEQLCFEITETTAIGNLISAMKLIDRLKAIGCQFALDDFGSGLSSFAYLKQLPVDFLKIDGVFVRDMNNNRFDKAMVESINHIGHVMGLKTIAEFVEDNAVLEQLSDLGIDYAQGFSIERPSLFFNAQQLDEGQIA